MAGLMDRTQQRRELRRASDADTDLASISASDNASDIDSGDASEEAGYNTTESASYKASASASHNAGEPASAKPGRTAGRKTGKKASGKTSSKASPAPRRGVGRPPGPDRQAITVRVLAEHDAKLTAAWDQKGMRPQQVIDAALAAWFAHHLEDDT